MAACWKILDTFHDRPDQFTKDLMAEITTFKKIYNYIYERQLEFYMIVQNKAGEAKCYYNRSTTRLKNQRYQ
jgi:hypothetical protein